MRFAVGPLYAAPVMSARKRTWIVLRTFSYETHGSAPARRKRSGHSLREAHCTTSYETDVMSEKIKIKKR
jgi:hypothetical protein